MANRLSLLRFVESGVRPCRIERVNKVREVTTLGYHIILLFPLHLLIIYIAPWLLFIELLFGLLNSNSLRSSTILYFSADRPNAHIFLFRIILRDIPNSITPQNTLRLLPIPVGLFVLPCTRQCRRSPPPPPLLPPPLLFLCPVTGVRYNSLLWICTLHTLTWPVIYLLVGLLD